MFGGPVSFLEQLKTVIAHRNDCYVVAGVAYAARCTPRMSVHFSAVSFTMTS